MAELGSTQHRDPKLERRRSRPLLALVIGLLLALVAAEITLRRTGNGPWREIVYFPDMPLMHEPDPELGWRNKPGRYEFGLGEPIHMTFWPDHARATAAQPAETPATAIVIGDSFTQGWAVSDEQTYAWKLQEAFPAQRFANLGCAGYGTTQSLLALRRRLSESGEHPRVIVYGFNDFHDGRNVATAGWLKNLAQLADRGHVAVPYGTVTAGGDLELHPPLRFPAWPLRRQLAIVAFLEERGAMLDARQRSLQARAVTEKLLLELARTADESGAKLLVVMLSEIVRGGNAPYREALSKSDVAVADCTHPGFASKAMRVPIYGHPNATMNAYWASCIERALDALDPGLAVRPHQAAS